MFHNIVALLLTTATNTNSTFIDVAVATTLITMKIRYFFLFHQFIPRKYLCKASGPFFSSTRAWGANGLGWAKS